MEVWTNRELAPRHLSFASPECCLLSLPKTRMYFCLKLSLDSFLFFLICTGSSRGFRGASQQRTLYLGGFCLLVHIVVRTKYRWKK